VCFVCVCVFWHHRNYCLYPNAKSKQSQLRNVSFIFIYHIIMAFKDIITIMSECVDVL